MTEAIPLAVGGSKVAEATWPSGSGTGGADLSGYDVVAFDVHPGLAGAVSVAVVDAAAGRFRITLQWAAGMPEGRTMTFRIRLVPKLAYPALLPQATERIWVDVQ